MYVVILISQDRVIDVKLCETFDIAVVEAMDIFDVGHITNLEELLRKHHRAYNVYKSIHIAEVST